MIELNINILEISGLLNIYIKRTLKLVVPKCAINAIKLI